jgi:hypothetical protein
MTYRTTKQRGYGAANRRLRKRVAKTVESGGATCWRCRKPIRPGSAWHLGHSDDRRFYMGPEHAACSYASGARATGGTVRLPTTSRPRSGFSRVW